MNLCIKENSTKRKTNVRIKKEEKPKWYDEQIEEVEASKEEIEDIERRLKEVIGD